MIEIHSSKSVSTVFFKLFFWITVVLLSLSTVSLLSLQTATFIDRIDLFLSILATFGLFGVAYSKALITVVFWRYFFYFGIIETFVYSIMLPIVGFNRYGRPFVFNGLYVFEIVYAFLLLYALHHYAYRRPLIWTKNCA